MTLPRATPRLLEPPRVVDVIIHMRLPARQTKDTEPIRSVVAQIITGYRMSASDIRRFATIMHALRPKTTKLTLLGDGRTVQLRFGTTESLDSVQCQLGAALKLFIEAQSTEQRQFRVILVPSSISKVVVVHASQTSNAARLRFDASQAPAADAAPPIIADWSCSAAAHDASSYKDDVLTLALLPSSRSLSHDELLGRLTSLLTRHYAAAAQGVQVIVLRENFPTPGRAAAQS